MYVRLFSAIVVCTLALSAQTVNPQILTGQYDSNRTSSTHNEIILSPSNVNVNQFGKLFSWSVDGWIFAQPLYVPQVSINGAPHNVVYVATMHNSVYAFDSDHPGAGPLWVVNLGPSVTAPTASGCPAQTFTGPELGILSTPVIDPSTNTLYAVSASPSGSGYVHYLHALDLSTKAEKFGGPVQIQASVPGTGYDAQSGRVSLNAASTDIQRTSLLLANGIVYLGFGNCGPDNDPWHGWLVGYNAANLQSQNFVFNTTPNGGQGGIWQSGRGIVADNSGDVYFNTGNATVYNSNDSTVTTGTSAGDAAQNDYAMRFLKLTPGGQVLASYPPANYTNLNNYDLDFSSSGPLLIPASNTLLTGGKDGIIYSFDAGNLSTPLQQFQATGTSACGYNSNGCDQIHGLAFWNNTLYVWGSNDVLRAYSFNRSTNQFNTSPVAVGTFQTTYNPAAFSISANGTVPSSGVLWAVTYNNVVHAYNASTLGAEIWNSSMNAGRDALPSYPRFVEPTVANGFVYVATHSNQVVAYGLLSDFTLSTSAPSLTVNTGSSGSVAISVTSLTGSSNVALSVASGLPSGASATFSPQTVAGSASSTMSINVPSSVAPGTYNLIINGTGSSSTRSANVSLVVATADTTPPQWSCCTSTSNGASTVMTFSAWDTQSGLKSITPVQVVGATVSIPNFTPGTNSVVNFTATESGWSSYVKFQLSDVAGNTSLIDPVFVNASRQPGPPVPFAVKDISPAEGVITIQNGSPGLKNLRITVINGNQSTKFEVAGLKDDQTEILNIASALPSDGATVTITPLGAPNGSAQLIFASGPMPSSK